MLAALVACSGLILSACGDNKDAGDPYAGGKTYDRLDAVTITGTPGSAPKVTWKGRTDAGKVETKTLTTGDGDKLATKDNVLVHLWIGNGFSQQTAFSTYDEKKAELVTVDDQLPEFLAGIRDATVGSRLAVTASADDAFGPAGNSQIG